MIKILIADDHKIIRDGIKLMLSGNKKFKVVAECSKGNEILPVLRTQEVDVILSDINMPEMSGVEAAEEVLQEFPNIKIIALTMQDQQSYITKMLQVGAVGYILKSSGEDIVIEAIEQVYGGKTYFSNEVSDIMMSKFMKNPKNKYVSGNTVLVEDLTEREVEIIKLIADELTNNEIAEKLFISPRTVDTHRRNLLQKLGAKNTAGLVKYAVQNNIL